MRAFCGWGIGTRITCVSNRRTIPCFQRWRRSPVCGSIVEDVVCELVSLRVWTLCVSPHTFRRQLNTHCFQHCFQCTWHLPFLVFGRVYKLYLLIYLLTCLLMESLHWGSGCAGSVWLICVFVEWFHAALHGCAGEPLRARQVSARQQRQSNACHRGICILRLYTGW